MSCRQFSTQKTLAFTHDSQHQRLKKLLGVFLHSSLHVAASLKRRAAELVGAGPYLGNSSENCVVLSAVWSSTIGTHGRVPGITHSSRGQKFVFTCWTVRKSWPWFGSSHSSNINLVELLSCLLFENIVTFWVADRAPMERNSCKEQLTGVVRKYNQSKWVKGCGKKMTDSVECEVGSAGWSWWRTPARGYREVWRVPVNTNCSCSGLLVSSHPGHTGPSFAFPCC